MCSSPAKGKSTPPAATSCCPGTFSRTRRAAKNLVRRYCPKTESASEDAIEAVMPVVTMQDNNENLPPEGKARRYPKTKKYTVNKKRTAAQSFERLKKHVPALEGKQDVSQLDVLLEAIQYIHALRKNLGKETTTFYAAAAASPLKPENNG